MDLKAGDKVLVTGRYDRSIGMVAKITPAGNIRLTNGELYRPDGSQKTKDIWNVSHIQPLTPEIENSLHCDSFIRKTLHIMHDTASITYEQAVEIRKILERSNDGKDL